MFSSSFLLKKLPCYKNDKPDWGINGCSVNIDRKRNIYKQATFYVKALHVKMYIHITHHPWSIVHLRWYMLCWYWGSNLSKSAKSLEEFHVDCCYSPGNHLTFTKQQKKGENWVGEKLISICILHTLIKVVLSSEVLSNVTLREQENRIVIKQENRTTTTTDG